MDTKLKVRLVVFLILLSLVLFGISIYRTSSLERAFDRQVKIAENLEKQGKFNEAVEEYKEALRFVARNDSKKRNFIASKVSEARKKAAKADEAAGIGSDTTQKTGKSTTTAAAVEFNEILPIEDIGILLPAVFMKMRSEVVSGKDVASVRFDDLDTRSSYFIYVYRHDSVSEAQEFIKTARKVLFPLRSKDVTMKGEYSGISGFYGENEKGDSALYFRYGNLVFELLLRSETLKREDRINNLLELQKALKKP